MEWLTDIEKRILLSALTREKKVCIEVDKQCEPREAYEQSLESVCKSLEHKFMYDRLFKTMEKQIKAELLDKVAEIVLNLPKKYIDNFDYVACALILNGLEELKAEVKQ